MCHLRSQRKEDQVKRDVQALEDTFEDLSALTTKELRRLSVRKVKLRLRESEVLSQQDVINEQQAAMSARLVEMSQDTIACKAGEPMHFSLIFTLWPHSRTA